MGIILYVLGVIGFTHIMVDGKVMLPIREWFANPSYDIASCWQYVWNNIILHPAKATTDCISSMINCYQCCGFWCGLVLGWLSLSTTWGEWLAAGFAGSFLANIAAVYMNYLEAQTIVNLPPDKEDA